MEKSNAAVRLNRLLEEKKYRILSGSALKITALVTMLIDHTAGVLLREIPACTAPFFPAISKTVTLYWCLRSIGRLAFPIYCFLITEGYAHTHDKKKYGINLLAFALISEIPWNLEHSGKLFYSSQNVFFTLFLGFLAICAYERYKEDMPELLISMAALFGASLLLRADYGAKGMAFILILHIFREQKIVQAFLGSCILSSPFAVSLAFIPINMYNGERGFIKSKPAKYAFYAIYPLHILLLYFLKKDGSDTDPNSHVSHTDIYAPKRFC